MARKALAQADLRAISQRLDRLVTEVLGTTWSGFGSRGSVPLATYTGWRNRRSAPDIASVLRMAAVFGLSPNWLLLGEGPELLGTRIPRGSLAEELRDHVLNVVFDRETERMLAQAILPSGEAMLEQLVADAQREKERHGRSWWSGLVRELARRYVEADEGSKRFLAQSLAQAILHPRRPRRAATGRRRR